MDEKSAIPKQRATSEKTDNTDIISETNSGAEAAAGAAEAKAAASPGSASEDQPEVRDELRQALDEPGVLCDICTGEKLKAQISCLDCGLTYCKIHFEPHYNVQKLKKHKLINPVKNLEDYICQEHDKPLERFCRDDQTFLCQFCTEHKTHNFVHINKTQTQIKDMIQEREDKINEIRHTLEHRKGNTERVISDSVEIFTALICAIQKLQAELLEVMKEKQKAAERQAEGFIKDLEQEITELKRRDTELEQLSHTEDHLHLLQIYTSLSSSLTTNCSDICVDSYVSVETVRQLQKSLEKEFTKTLKEIRQPVVSEELKRIHQHKVDVTLDPDTAHAFLILSKDRKEVSCGDKKQNGFLFCCDNPKRFDKYIDVLGKEGFSTGRFYYEVQVSGKTEWSLGVVRETVDRKGEIDVKPQNGFWTLILRNGNEYTACAEHPVILPLKVKPQKVGVFVDYEGSLVSFYDVEARSHIYSFRDQSFTEKLYPFFSPGLDDEGKNSDPLIITPVSNTE